MARFNIIEAIRERADLNAVALVQGARTLTYRELLERCDAIVTSLPKSQDPLRVGVQFPSGIDYVPLAMAVLAARHCFVPVPDELAPAERAELTQRTALNALIIGSDDGFQCKLLDPVAPSFPLDAFAALNPAFIRFSSGTTGKSKGVVLSHESLLDRIRGANEGLRMGPADRVLWVLPMAHHFAVSIVLYLYHGATTIIEEHHLGEDLLRAGSEHRATVMYGSPVHYRQLADAPGDVPWSALRLAVSTAAALDQKTADKFQRRFHQPLVQGLGIIEVGLPVLNLDAPADCAEAIGMPLPAYQCQLRDEHEGVGELCLRGPGMFDAYLDPWQPRASVLDEEGWFATGDLARRDAEGRIFLCGRRKSVINVGGMKVFPEEVERVLDAHPKVQRSFVEARAHPLFGEVPVACYIPGAPAPTLAELRAHCREHLASYKIPLIFSVVTSLPTTASGKLLRRTPSSDS